MGKNFASGLLAGVTAAVIWMAISLWTGADTAATGMWALVFLIVVTLVTTITAFTISRNVRGGAARQ